MLVKSLAMPMEAVAGGGTGSGASTSAAGGSGGAPPTATDPVLTNAAPATTTTGAETSRAFAARLSARVALGDGSGLSRADRAAPREVVDLLRGMSAHAAFTPFDDSLPIPGVDGTLAERMRGTEASKRCHAKTGTLSNVSALSGYCTTASGHLIAFSILNNRVWPPSARTAQDRIVKTIAKLD
jgi:D-alanyl-D-alanine carboxypeptidase/D-alanyl-D-alanine-endopeptidase (penicillin-binding protein 4)